MNLIVSAKFHKNIISKLFNAPINTFYDRIPIGRILNRMSSDLSDIDD